VPTGRPTGWPTDPIQQLISFNVTQNLHNVNMESFNTDIDHCEDALKETVSKLVDLFTEEGFILRGQALHYENDIYDFRNQGKIIR
jgi:hypothetical protein